MEAQHAPPFGALALSLLFAGCAGGQNTLPQAVPGQSISKPGLPLHRGACAPISSSANFNGTAISPGSWIWFSSVVSMPGNKGTLQVQMIKSQITFSDGSQNYEIDGPAMSFALTDGDGAHLTFKSSRFRLKAPIGTAGNDFLNGIAYQTTSGLPGGIQNVTWSAEFYGTTKQQINWQWGAAVYTNFASNYAQLDVKALDDNHYPPYNSDDAGTPEAYKQYVSGGATGGGGGNYTGGLSGTTKITPCL